MIVGTAGHIDHGKTTLIRALTGVDTDRLKEEKARGISIELGYAYTPLPNGEVIGYVDVPGHEKLVHTMAAGACGIDFVLLVIAADDGIMPQTREHLAIVRLLGIEGGAVALTKTDRVDGERIRTVRDEIGAWLAETPFAQLPIFETRAHETGDAGVAALSAYLHGHATGCEGRHDDHRFFRLAIDRVFTLSGTGTIVTGTVLAGVVRVGDWLSVAPRGRETRVRVRGIHAQNRPAQAGHAGERCALNLAGIAKEQIARGDWIVEECLVAGSERIDADLEWLPDSKLELKHGMPLHVHLGTLHRVARVVSIENAAGMGRVQMVFDTPVCALPGDRFIVRDAQATRTVGGGRVLDPFAPSRKRASPERRMWLDALAAWLDTGRIDAILRQAPAGIRRDTLERLIGRDSKSIELPGDAVAVRLSHAPCADPQDEYFVHRSVWNALRAGVRGALEAFHARVPDEQGPDSARLRRIAAPLVDEPLWRELIASMAASGEVSRSGPWVHLPEHRAHLGPDEERLSERLLPLVGAAQYEPSWVRELAQALDVQETSLRDLMRKLSRRGQLFQVVPDLFLSCEAAHRSARLIEKLIAEGGGRLEAAAFRDASGLGRKRAIQILEFFDRMGFTRFQRGVRMLRADSHLLEMF